MKQVTLTGLGTQLGAVMPQDFVRALGWVRGDKLACFVERGDIVFRNSSQRAARFTRTFRGRKENRIEADGR